MQQRRRALLLDQAGADVQDIFTTLANTGQLYDSAAAIAALNAYFVPQVNSAFARQTFHQIEQRPGETVQQFPKWLRWTAKAYEYGDDL